MEGVPRIITKHYSWLWEELAGPDGAAFSEHWHYDATGALIARHRVARARSERPTISTDPRAGEIMRERLGMTMRSRPMGRPRV